MFEKEIKFINDLTISKLKGLGEYLTLNEIKKAGIHPAIITYIEGEIDFLIYEDRQKLLKNSIFDYSGKTIENCFVPISEEIKKSKKFSLEYISNLVLHSVSFNINYLTRPNWALVKFLFDNADVKSTSEIRSILNYLHYYDYLKKIILSYLDKKNLLKLEKFQLEELLIKINQLGNENNSLPIIETAVNSISDFVNFYEFKKKAINVNTIEKFLEDKNFETPLNIIKEKFDSSLQNVLAEPVEIIAVIKTELEKKALQEKIKNELRSETQFVEVEEKTDEPAEETLEVLEEVEPEESPVNNDDDIPEETVIPEENIEEESLSKEFNISDEKTLEIKEDQEDILISDKIENLASDETEISEPDSKLESEESNTNSVNIPKIIDEEKTQSDTVEDFSVNENELEDIFEPEEDFIEEEIEEKEDDIELIEIEEEKFDPVDEKPEELIQDELEAEEVSEDQNLSEDNEDAADKSAEVESKQQDNNLDFSRIKLLDKPVEQENDTKEVEIKNTIEPKEVKEENPFDEFIDDNEGLEKLSEEIEASKLNLKVPIGNPTSMSSIKDPEPKEEINPDDFTQEVERTNELTTDVIVEEEFTDENSFEEDKISKEIQTSLQEEEKKEVSLEEENRDPLPEIDIADLLEHKKMTKIIEVIFDYDMEDFTNCIDKVSECKNEVQAQTVLDNLFRQNNVKPTRKEAELFKDILFEYFKRK